MTETKPYAMLKIKETRQNDVTFFRVAGPNPESLIDYVLPRIRPKSRKFYEKEIARELREGGNSIVDRHAGQGSYYMLVLEEQKVTNAPSHATAPV